MERTPIEQDDVVNARPASANSATGAGHSRACKLAAFAVVAVAWFVFDRAAKALAESYAVGTVFAGPFAGILQFKLVHNTGAAWSLFSDSTLALGVFGVVLCAVIAIAVVLFARHLTLPECLALGLVVAGGIGNAVDRFQFGYVVDFIQTLFISFPTFNVADIGVTCGIFLFVILFIVRSHKAEREGE